MKYLDMSTHVDCRMEAPITAKQRGISLIVVMILLVVIGLTSAAAIRSATSNERVTNNLRMQNLAQQYAEAALRFCEAQLSLNDAARVPTLQAANIVDVAYDAPSGWAQTVTWVGTGGASASRTTVVASALSSADSSFVPTVLPQCVVERQALPDAATFAFVVTARGFSPDYSAVAATGETKSGSVVWLQSILAMN